MNQYKIFFSLDLTKVKNKHWNTVETIKTYTLIISNIEIDDIVLYINLTKVKHKHENG